MSLRSHWVRRGLQTPPKLFHTKFIEWTDHGNVVHILAMKFPDGWAQWCELLPGEGFDEAHPLRGWPADEASIAPFRFGKINCAACRFMWKLRVNRGEPPRHRFVTALTGVEGGCIP